MAKFKYSFCILTYNQAPFVAEAVRSALYQDCLPLEIVISDDCSSDATFDITSELVKFYDGPHSVKLYRNSRNLGLAGNINRVHELASGDVIIAAAGDDISRSDRARRIMDAFETGDASLVCSQVDLIDLNGNPLELSMGNPTFYKEWTLTDAATSTALYVGATGSWKRSLYTDYGQIDENAYEDLVLGFRAALEGSVEVLNEPLVKYRLGFGVTSAAQLSSSQKASRDFQRKMLVTHLSVYRQRQRDAAKFGLLGGSEIVCALRKAEEMAFIRFLYNDGDIWNLLKAAAKRPRFVKRTVFSEMRRLKKLKKAQMI